ncbi:PsiF family protein [Budvicia aquatica]|nr:PsiF family protein [Budvicia aquatica]VFS46025.1 Phosphate starvation-inducible protein psiF precursor [Budvicia aquatica]
MSNCLKAEPAATDKKDLTPQQKKMADCSTEAAGKELKGEDRKTFMATCLKKAA